MSDYYGTASGFYARYPALATKITSAELDTSYLPQASEWIERKLAGNFTVPFSSNNKTARELTYLKSLHYYRLGTPNPVDSDELVNELKDAIDGLLGGEEGMAVDSGTGGPVFADPTETLPQDEPFSTAGFPNTFTMDEPEFQEVDPDLINYERDRRR